MEPRVVSDIGGRGNLGNKANFVEWMRRSGRTDAETKEALDDLKIDRRRKHSLMRDYFNLTPAGSPPSTQAEEFLVTMGSFQIDGFVPWSAVPIPEPVTWAQREDPDEAAPKISHPPAHTSSMTTFPAPRVRDHKVSWADGGEDMDHDFPRRKLRKLVHPDVRLLWYTGRAMEQNQVAAAMGLFDEEVARARANPAAPL